MLLVGIMAYELSGRTAGVIGTVVGLIVVLAILGATIGDVFTNMDLVVNEFFTYTNANSTLLAALVPVLGILVAIGILFGIVELIGRASGV